MEIDFEFGLGWFGIDFSQILGWHKLYMFGNFYCNFSMFRESVISLMKLQFGEPVFDVIQIFPLFRHFPSFCAIKAINE